MSRIPESMFVTHSTLFVHVPNSIFVGGHLRDTRKRTHDETTFVNTLIPSVVFFGKNRTISPGTGTNESGWK